MNTNIILVTLYLFQISLKFEEEAKHLMTIPQKPRKKKVVPSTISSTISIIKKEEELYINIDHLNKDIIDTNHALLQMPKQELTKIFQLK